MITVPLSLLLTQTETNLISNNIMKVHNGSLSLSLSLSAEATFSMRKCIYYRDLGPERSRASASEVP